MTYPPQDPYRQPQSPHQPPTQPMPGQPQPPQQWPPTQPMPAGYPPQSPTTPVPPKKGTSTGKVVAGIVAGLVGLCCISGIISVASGSDTSTSTTGDTKAATAPTTAAAAPTTAAAATTQATAPKPQSGALAVVAWWTGGAKDRVQAIGQDFTNLSDAAGSGDQPGVRAACSKAQKDVEAAQANGQVPDAQAQSLWAAALASYARASADCIAGIDSGNMDLVTKSAGEISAGNDSTHQLAARIQELGNGG